MHNPHAGQSTKRQPCGRSTAASQGWQPLQAAILLAALLAPADGAAASARGSSGTSGVCTSYLSSTTGSSRLPACDFERQSYLDGAWVRRQGACSLAAAGSSTGTSRTNAQEGSGLGTGSSSSRAEDGGAAPPGQAALLARHAYDYAPVCNRGLVRCHVADPTACPPRAAAILDWDWRPAACGLAPFDAAAFDAAIAGKRVAFVGDSLSRQHYNSLKMLLRSEIVDDGWLHLVRARSPLVRRKVLPFGLEYVVTRRRANISFTGSVYFAGESLRESGLRFRQPVKWADMLILNMGVHWHRRDKTFAHYRQAVDTALRSVKNHFRGELLIFRTTHTGHYECAGAARPLAAAPLLTPRTDRYHWRQPPLAELVWRDKWEALRLPHRFAYLNVSLSNLRADAHPVWKLRRRGGKAVRLDDCLHWCLPGVPDTWNWLLLNLLLQHNAQQAARTSAAG